MVTHSIGLSEVFLREAVAEDLWGWVRRLTVAAHVQNGKYNWFEMSSVIICSVSCLLVCRLARHVHNLRSMYSCSHCATS